MAGNTDLQQYSYVGPYSVHDGFSVNAEAYSMPDLAPQDHNEHRQLNNGAHGSPSIDSTMPANGGDLNDDHEDDVIVLYFCSSDGEKVPIEMPCSGTVAQLRVRVLLQMYAQCCSCLFGERR